MARTPHTPTPADSTPAKIWIRNELLQFVDAIAERDERSRAYVVNQALDQWRKQLERGRRNRGAKNR